MYLKACNFVFQVIIFVKTVARCTALAKLLVNQNFPAICIHRGMAQEERYVRLVNVQKLSDIHAATAFIFEET